MQQLSAQCLSLSLEKIGLTIDKIEDLLVEFTYAFADNPRRIEILALFSLTVEIDEDWGIFTIINADGHRHGVQLGV